jgi:hypothetical protein
MKTKTVFIFVSLLSVIGMTDIAFAVNWPLRINQAGQYLEDRDGIPFLVVGDTAWSMAAQLDRTEVVTYLNNRQSKGFTAIIVNVIEHAFAQNPPNNYANEHPFSTGSSDWSVPNESYWTHIDYILEEAKSRDIVVFLFPAYVGFGCGDQGWAMDMIGQTDTDMTQYGEFLGNRYKDQGNLIWVSGGDAPCGDCPPLCSRVSAVVTGIKNYDTQHLHTAHSSRYRSAMDDYNESWLNINSTYSDSSSPANDIKHDYDRSGAKPFFFIEGFYEGESANSSIDLEKQFFAPYLGGALIGHFFGNNPIWLFDPGWDGNFGIDSPGSRVTSNMGKLMRSRAWWRMKPDYNNALVVSGKGLITDPDYKSAAKTSDGETAIIWFPASTEIAVDLSEMRGTQTKAWWWDPADNSATLIGTYATGGTENFKPDNSEMVLILDDFDSDLAAPGTTVYPAEPVDTTPPLPPRNLRVVP